MKCTDASDQLVEYLLDDLSEIEQDALRQHVESCPHCASELEQLSHAVELLYLAAPERDVTTSGKQQLIQQIVRSKRLPVESLAVNVSSTSRMRITRWLVAFAAGVCFAVVLIPWFRSDRANLATTSENSDVPAWLANLEQNFQQLKFVSTSIGKALPHPQAVVMLDPLANQAQLLVINLPRIDPHQALVAWVFAADQRLLERHRLEINDDVGGVSIDADPNLIRAISVTLESVSPENSLALPDEASKEVILKLKLAS